MIPIMIDILLLSFFSLFKFSISAEVHPSMFCVLRTGPTLFKDECIRRRNGGYRVLSYGKNIGSHGITNDIKHQTRPNSFLSKTAWQDQPFPFGRLIILSSSYLYH